MQWKKVSKAETVRDFVIEKTGRTPEELKNVAETYRIAHFDKIKELLLYAKNTGLPVRMVGDYDSDGIWSVIILCYLMTELNIRYEIYMPKRITEGYGLSPKIVNRMSDGGILLTVDNGIKAVEGIAMAKEKGMKIIILDHHQAGDILPAADVIIDPAALGEADFLHYCGAGLAYKLAEYILGKENRLMPYLSVYAAVATIGDCVELTGDNRKIVKEGLDNLKKGRLTSPVSLLMQKCRINESSTATDIAFNVVPVINAPGRLYDNGAETVVSALVSRNGMEENIERLLQINMTRRETVERFMNRINLDKIKTDSRKAVFIYDPEIPEGIAGIIAGKVTEATERPCFVYTDAREPGYIKGSVRSSSNDYSIIEIIERYPELYTKAGGHRKAAGLTIPLVNLSKQEEMICGELPEVKTEECLPYDLEIREEDFIRTAEEILSLEPTGEGNPAPIVRIRAKLIPDRYGRTFMTMGKQKEHVKFFCKGFNAVAFHSSVNPENRTDIIDMTGRVTENIYKNVRSIQLIIQDFRFC